MIPIVYVTGTLYSGRASTLEAHRRHIVELAKIGAVGLSPVAYVSFINNQEQWPDAWRTFAKAIIPRCAEVHLITDPSGNMINSVKRDLEIANSCNITLKFVDPQKLLKSPTAAQSTK